MTPDQTAEALVAIRAASDRWARPSELGPLEISITPPRGDVDRELARRYADLGVDRLVLRPPRLGDADAYERCVANIATQLVDRVYARSTRKSAGFLSICRGWNEDFVHAASWRPSATERWSRAVSISRKAHRPS